MKGELLQTTLINKIISKLFRGRAVVRSRTLLLLAAFLLSGLSALAQIHTGSITGLVTDSSGGVVPKAQIKITNVDTDVTLDLVTDSAGLYVAPNLLPGHYSVAVDLAGFQGQSKVGLVLSLSQTLTVSFTLHPGGQKQEVTVVGTAQQLVDTTKSTMGDVITSQAVSDLPLNGRDFMDLVPLTAGVVPPPEGSNKYYTNGSRGAGTGFLIDGADVTSPSIDPPRVLPNLEGIGEFSVTTSNFTAEYGRVLGGLVNTHIKSGTNAYHGSAFEYVRNTSLDARNFFDIPNRLPFHLNQFGGSLGGPIVKDKLFIFGDYQGTREIAGATVFTNVPTEAERGGNFNDLLPGTTIYDPLTFPRTQFDYNGIPNAIPPTRFDPAAAHMIALFPNPNATFTASSPYDYIVPQDSSSNEGGFDIRADYNATNKDRFSVIVVWNNSGGILGDVLNSRLNGNLIGGGGNIGVRARDYTLNYTRTISPTMVNEFTFAWTRSILYADSQDGQQYDPNLGIPGLNTSSTDLTLSGFPLFDPVGYSVFGGSAGTPSTQNHNIPQLSDNLSWVRGRHAFKTGFSADFRQYNLGQSLFTRGLYVFVPYATSSFPANELSGGNAIASALLGYPYEVRRQILPAMGERIKEDGAYFQDDYKVSKRLTLNLGVRWDLYMPSTEEFNRLGDFDPNTVTVRVAGQNGNSRSTLDADKHDFSPHLGFAYQATSDGKTVVRGGYAIAYLNLVTQEVGTVDHRLIENPPVSRDYTTVNFPLGPVPVAGISVPTVSAGYPAAGQYGPSTVAGVLPFQNPQSLCCGAFTYFIPQSQPMPYQQVYGLDIQRALPGNILLDIGYAGSRGTHLTGLRDLNQAPPGPTAATPRSPISPNIGNVDALENRENSFYNALQLKVERRFSAGFYLMANYTYAHSIDNGSVSASAANDPIASGGGYPQNSFDTNAERGNSDFDLRNRAVVSFIYELPFGTGKKYLSSSSRVVDAFLGGWQVNGIFQGQGGFPFTAELANGSSDINSSADGSPVRPYLIGNPNLNSGQSIHHWFNVAAFAVPGQDGTPAYTFGNTGRNTLRGPDFLNFDYSMFKTFKLTERVNLVFRAELFDLTNHPNFALPNQAVDQPQGGFITSTIANPRQVQFALKLLF
jgi:hypothetical protein